MHEDAPAQHSRPVGTDPDGRRRCARCVYDDATPNITFDDAGVCNYCHLHDEMDREYPTGAEGKRRLEAMADEMRAAGKGKRFDCIVGVSGGCDSSFLVHKAVELGLRPLAVHFDNTWNSPVATRNIFNVLEHLDVELETYVVDNREYDDVYRSFLHAGTPDLESPTDIGFMSTLYRAAEQHGIRYIIEGHSFRTEGVAPLGWLYMDSRYIRSVHERHGRVPLKTLPEMPLRKFLKWSAFSGVRRIRPLYWMDYDKEATKRFLAEHLGWEWYGGHHLENRFTAFYHTYFLPQRWNIDMRTLGHGALVRSGQLEREQALAELAVPQRCDPEILELVKKRLELSDDELHALMTMPKHTYREYDSYKRTFERLRPLFWLLYKADRVPKSFYVKFASKRD